VVETVDAKALEVIHAQVDAPLDGTLTSAHTAVLHR
jgi:hypothetical protein